MYRRFWNDGNVVHEAQSKQAGSQAGAKAVGELYVGGADDGAP